MGVLGAVLSTILCSFLLGLLIMNETISVSGVEIVSGIVIFASVMTWTLLAIRKIPLSKLPVALSMAAAYILISLFIGGILQTSDRIQITWMAIIPVLASAVAGIWGSAQKKNRR